MALPPRFRNRVAGDEDLLATANSLAQDFVDLGLLEETTGQKRNRVFAYRPYLDLFGPSLRRDP